MREIDDAYMNDLNMLATDSEMQGSLKARILNIDWSIAFAQEKFSDQTMIIQCCQM